MNHREVRLKFLIMCIVHLMRWDILHKNQFPLGGDALRVYLLVIQTFSKLSIEGLMITIWETSCFVRAGDSFGKTQEYAWDKINHVCLKRRL